MTLGLLGVFSAGLLTFVTPCVLPLIPIYLGALVGGDLQNADLSKRGQLLFRAGLFSLGFIAVFTLMGLTASSIGGFLTEHKGALQVAGALLIFVFGLKFLGIIRIPFMDRIVRADDTKVQTRFGSINALVMGVVFAAGWSPCVGPVLGSVLTYTASTTSSPLTGAAYLALYGAGFALPLLVTAIFAEAGVRLLKRINPFLPKIERAIGLLLVFVAASLIFDIAQAARLDANAPQTREQQIAELTQNEQGKTWPVMVEFYSKDCVVCQRMAPIMEGISQVCDGRKVLVKQFDVSTAEHRHMAGHFRLVGLPTFVFLDTEGHEVARLVGEQTEKTLKQALSALRGEPCPGLGEIPENLLEQFPADQDNAACGSGIAPLPNPEEQVGCGV